MDESLEDVDALDEIQNIDYAVLAVIATAISTICVLLHWIHKERKKKSKAPVIDQGIRECILLMADSVTKVANAIKSSTRSSQERNMYTELMTELASIPGFSEEEIDMIYDNLSKNPTLIPSFLSKPTDSKARWMRKELGN